MKLKEIKPNERNPRVIKKDKLEKLKQSIKNFEKMMSLRPIVVDETNTILGGNMRYQAIKALGYKDIPSEWVKRAEDLTEDEKRRFIIEDNVGFGEWDWDMLANEWDEEDLAEWGLEIPFIENTKEKTKNEEEELRPFFFSHILISYDINKHDEVMKAIESLLNKEGIEIEKSSN